MTAFCQLGRITPPNSTPVLDSFPNRSEASLAIVIRRERHVSIAQARRVIGSIKWYHLGFCFFWAVVFVGFALPHSNPGGGLRVFSLCQQTTTIVVIALAALSSGGRREFQPRDATLAGVLLAAGSLMFYLAFYGEYSLASVVVAAIVVGFAQASFFLMWQYFYANEGTARANVCIPASAALSMVLCLIVSWLPIEWTVLCAVIILPALASLSLSLSLSEVEPYERTPLSVPVAAHLISDMWKPVFCVCAIGLVWRVIGYLGGGAADGFSIAVMAGMSCAALLVSAIELLSERGFDVLNVYQYMFPLVTGAFLLPTLLGTQWLEFVYAMTMFGFEMVNLLLLITCAVYASRYELDPSVVYASCVGPTLAALLVGDVIGMLLTDRALLDVALTVELLFVCVYLLAMVLLLVSVGRKAFTRRTVEKVPEDRLLSESEDLSSHPNETAGAQASDEQPETAPDSSRTTRAFAQTPEREPRLEDRIAAIEHAEPLSARELEVLNLILKGNTVAAVSRKLFISENTVRGHTKHIYRKLSVHSKQELIDLLN